MTRWMAYCLPPLLGAALAISPVPALASDIYLESSTYVPARGIDGGSAHVLLYEYVTLDTLDTLGPGLYLQAGAWGRSDLADETYDRETNGELQYAFLGWRAPRLNAEARVGRLSLTAGVARNEVFDGLLLGGDLPSGFDVTLFGGVPVEVDGNGRSSDALFGARFSQGRPGLYRLGLSYLQEQDAGGATREEAGSDLFLAPLPLVEVTGASLYNLIDSAWSRHDYRLALGPFARRVRIIATWVQTDYRSFFQSPTNPALDPIRDEKLDRIGGQFDLLLGLGFTLSGGYTAYQYDISGDARAIETRLDWSGTTTTAGGGYRQVLGDSIRDRYRQISAYATTGIGPFHISAGAERLDYEAPINGVESATTGTLGLRYTASRSLELSASAEYGETPQFEQEFKGLLAVLWRYDTATKKGNARR